MNGGSLLRGRGRSIPAEDNYEFKEVITQLRIRHWIQLPSMRVFPRCTVLRRSLKLIFSILERFSTVEGQEKNVSTNISISRNYKHHKTKLSSDISFMAKMSFEKEF